MKKYPYTLVSISLVLLLASCGSSQKGEPKIIDSARIVHDPIENRRTSIINLIATPEKYEGHLVKVAGFLNFEPNGNALYLHKDDYDHGIYKNSIYINMSEDSVAKMYPHNKRYVVVEGLFSLNQGYMNSFSGSLRDVKCLYDKPLDIRRPVKKRKDRVHAKY
jgi:hypothetical protein